MATVDERALAGAGQDRARASAERSGMVVPRVFSTEGVSPYDQVDWDLRTAEIKDESGELIFEQTDCEVPTVWSQLATNVVGSKYFYGEIDTPERETQRPPAHPPRHPHDRRLGHSRTATSPPTRTASGSIAS